MIRNIKVNQPVEFLGVPSDKLEEAKKILNDNNIEWNQYDNAHSVLSDTEARFTADRIKDKATDFYIEKEVTDEQVESFVNNLYNNIYDTLKDEYGIYDNERLYEIEMASFFDFKGEIK